jgi:hypothetical protein
MGSPPFITRVVGLHPRANLTVRSFITLAGGGVDGVSFAKNVRYRFNGLVTR